VLLFAAFLACLPSDHSTDAPGDGDPRLAIVHDGRSHAILSGPSSAAARFDPSGFTLTGDGAALRLEFVRFGRGEATEPVRAAHTSTARGSRLDLERGDGLVEWFVNTGRGVEHGFDVATRSAGDGLVTVELAVLGETVPVVDADERGAAFVDALGRVHWTYRGLVAFDRDGDLLPARMVATGATLVLEVDDTLADYPITIDPIAQEAYLKAADVDVDDWFGFSVAISGDTAVVGVLQEDSNALGIDGDATNEAALNAGAAYVFVRSSGVWTQQAYLKASNTDAGDGFGRSVAIDGDTIAVGASSEASNATGVDGDESNDSLFGAGAVYVFVRSGVVWSQQAYIKASNTGSVDRFGQSMALDGDTLVVGAHLEDSSATGVDGDASDNSAANSGAAYVFTRTAGVWSQQAYLKASNTGASDFFGWAVDVDDDTIVVGANIESSSASTIDGDGTNDDSSASGAAYVFTRTGGVWSQQAYLKASNNDPNDEFGRSVAVSADRVVVGAYQEDGAGTGLGADPSNDAGFSAGAVYVFERSGSTWSQTAYVKPAASPLGDRFGVSVALDGSRFVVGSFGEASNGVGPYSSQTNNSAANTGAVYVFDFSGGTWQQTGYLKASNSQTLDSFGEAVALDGDAVLVGVRNEDSAATGVNGDGSDNSTSGAGAAYVFDLTAPWARVPGCLGNTGSFALPSTPPQMGTTVSIDLNAGAITTGVSALYYGVLGIDALGCGLPLGADELLLALVPFPTSLGLAPLVGGTSTFSLGLPLLPPLAGAEISLQAAIVDTSTFATEVSNVLAFTLEL